MSQKIKLPSNKNFGIVFCIVFFIIATWPILSENNIRIWSLILSFIFLILGLLNSKLLEPLNKIWFKFGLILGKLVAPIVMGIIFFFVVTPTGLIMKILRKDLLNLKKNNSTTYWIKKDNSNSNFKNQFWSYEFFNWILEFHKSKKKILAIANNFSIGFIWRFNSFEPRNSSSPVYLYNILICDKYTRNISILSW